MAAGHLLEVLQVVAIVPDELVVDADGAVGGHGYDDGNGHIVCCCFRWSFIAQGLHRLLEFLVALSGLHFLDRNLAFDGRPRVVIF